MNDYVVEVLFGAFALLMILGAPITVALGVAALAAMYYLGDNPIKMVQMAWSYQLIFVNLTSSVIHIRGKQSGVNGLRIDMLTQV